MAKKKRNNRNQNRTQKQNRKAPPHSSVQEPGRPPKKKPSHQPSMGQKVVRKSGEITKSVVLSGAHTAVDAAKGTVKYGGGKAREKIHAMVREAEQDNAALETAHKAERIGEKVLRSGLQKSLQITHNQLKKIGEDSRKKGGNTSGKTTSNIGVTSSSQVDESGTPLPRTDPSTKSVPNQKASKEKLHHGKTSHPAKPSRLRFFDSSESKERKSAFKDMWETPSAQLGATVDFSPKEAGLLSRGLQTGKNVALGGLRMGKDKAIMEFRGKLEQSSADNSAVKAANHAEQVLERPTKYVLKKGTDFVVKPIQKLSNKVRSAVRHRYLVRKKAFLAKHQRVAQARGVVMKAKAIVKELILKSKPILTVLGICLLIYAINSMIVGPITAVLSRAGLEYLATTTYPVANEDITGSTVQWKDLEVALQQRIENIESELPNYDEYRYDIDPMQHNPFELISYLAAMHMEFTHPQVQAEIADLFAQTNALQLVEETEIRYDENDDPYEWEILNIILNPKPFEEVIVPKLTAANAKDLYDVYMGSGGNQQAFGNPFTFYWENNITCYYGNRKNPTGAGYEFHTGLDIAAPDGTPIRSVQQGVVVVSGWHDLYGNYIVIRNESEISTLYAHCSALYAVVGDVVRQGQIIAAVGSTGNSTGNHLHIEIKLGTERVNPLFYIQTYDE